MGSRLLIDACTVRSDDIIFSLRFEVALDLILETNLGFFVVEFYSSCSELGILSDFVNCLCVWAVTEQQQQPRLLAEGLEIKNLRVVDENYSPEPAGDGDGVIDKFKEGFKTFKIEKYL